LTQIRAEVRRKNNQIDKPTKSKNKKSVSKVRKSISFNTRISLSSFQHNRTNLSQMLSNLSQFSDNEILSDHNNEDEIK
jgi:hypothetical protein